MNRLSQRLNALESCSMVGHPERFFQIIYNPKATDLSEDDFVSTEKERLGITADDGLIIIRLVSPQAAGGVGK